VLEEGIPAKELERPSAASDFADTPISPSILTVKPPARALVSNACHASL